MDDPSFSIVIPTYQRRETICAAVHALIAQRYDGPIELIIVVDGSTDGTAQSLGQLKPPFPMQIIEQENRGAAAARNRGAAEASGDIILFLDDDMIAESDLLEQHSVMHRAGADAVTGDMHLHPDVPEGFLWKDLSMVADWERDAPATPFDIFTGQLSIRRTVFTDLGGFDESYTQSGGYGNEDIDFGVKLVERYVVRHNANAVTRQLTSVGPRQFMRRARLLGRADVSFARKHPQLAEELLERRGAARPMIRWFYRPISRIPLVARILAAVAVGAAELGLKTRLRSNRNLARLFSIAYSMSYWSAVDTALKRPDSTSGA